MLAKFRKNENIVLLIYLTTNKQSNPEHEKDEEYSTYLFLLSSICSICRKNIIGVIWCFFTGFIKIGLLEKQTFNDYFP